MKRNGTAAIAAIAIAVFSIPGPASAEEGGTGHCVPGSIASFIDGVPPSETFVVRLNLLYYRGSVGADQPLPIAGLTAFGAEASSWATGLTMLWRPPGIFCGRLSDAMSATIPYVRLDLSATVNTTLLSGAPVSVRRSTGTSGLGDIVLMPLMLNYSVSRDFNVNIRTGVYAPTGSYELGRLANTGKNFWTFEPIPGLMYFGQKNGIETSVFVGADFNTENGATDYSSGTQFHVDGTVARHLPLLGGLAGLGVTGYDDDQVTGDSGSGATLGNFKGMTTGVGPALSYAGKLGTHDTVVEIKWLHEVETRNRLESDIFWLKWVCKV